MRRKVQLLNQLGQLIVERKFKCYCTVFAVFILYLRQFPSISARELKLGGAIQRSVFSATRLKGLCKGGGGNFGILRLFFFFSLPSPVSRIMSNIPVSAPSKPVAQRLAVVFH